MSATVRLRQDRTSVLKASDSPRASMSDPLITQNAENHLLEFDQLPEWRQDNEYILSGYRSSTNSFHKCLQSIKSRHNETVNIWSHILGAITFAVLPIWVYTTIYPRYGDAGAADIAVFSTFFFGVAICFFLSATFHIFCNHSEHISVLGNTLDYLGIIILMWGSTIPSVYYGFFCDPSLQKVYWALVTVFALLCTIATINPQFRHPKLRPYRAAMYSCLGLSALIFIIHGILLHGFKTQQSRMSLSWMGIMAALNLMGAGAYACRIPERLYPRKYDIYGASHQIFHIMVVFAGIAHLVGLLKAFDHIHSQANIC